MVFLSHAVSDARMNDEEYTDPVETTIYGTRWAANDIPTYEMPEGNMPANVAYRLIKDELANRCVNIIARLFNAPMDDAHAESLGCSTVGSTEAIILATLAMKRRWQLARKAKGLSTENPNFIMGANCQVAWHKAMRYLEIEGREVPCTKELLYMDPKKAVALVDENTIGVCAILGSTYTGHYEDVQTLDSLLEAKCKENGYDVGIHVDAASGGFVTPFTVPNLVWDFRLPRVHSINVSGHKYGLTYPGIGWAVWRGKDYLPEDLVFRINYLGSDQASFTLNFSKGASNIIAQYYVLIRLGKLGFTHIMKNLISNADYLSDQLEATGKFNILSEKSGRGLPLVAFSLKAKKVYDEFDLSSKLRERGWIVPAYTMAHELEDMKLVRVVVREDFSRNRSEILLRDILAAISLLDSLDEKALESHRKYRRSSARHRHRSTLSPNRAPNTKGKAGKAKTAPGVC
ncbi:glutamate decarboxylase [Mucor mucedo]|uniref:glutamate decarboxylase n=1 Tax=Mucor mucedo TaxID=29922 RepID=UPI0022204E5F|nr:glutamate decarboxylase [Mucor mucedo]KAI7889522.1 glutamate decarboxylase [Mucor mucedo]